MQQAGEAGINQEEEDEDEEEGSATCLHWVLRACLSLEWSAFSAFSCASAS